jgi:nicotinamidase-related amidase
MKNYLVVIDMQKDFVTGCLGSKEAQDMMGKLVDYIKNFDGEVIYTKDTHFENYMETQEGKNLPVPHCIKGTDGWELMSELDKLQKERNSKVYEKVTFPSKDLAMELARKNEEETIGTITLVGVCTDICVVSNALTIKAFLPETPIQVVEELTEATSREMKAKTLDVMRSCQIAIV